MSQSALTPDRPVSYENALAQGDVAIGATRPRQTTPAPTPFRDLLAGSVSVLMGGAEVATHVLGAPTLAAAVQTVRSQATTAIIGSPLAGFGVAASAVAALPGVAPPSAPSAGPAATATPSVLGTVTGGSDGSELATMQAMQRESQAFNMQLLGLQDQVQQDSQRFTTLSNVLRAKHDTAKAAVSNIRA
jgi:hypothetical protein